ncbi:hypothetical protein B0T26DRAFT_864599 [Lasiosphaeria miniovina]|uniref:Uncharacterized protein n=1 Tax=Lasiosphaeria miniovina TaxID=1954250 RepID=A0AA39ZU58_9PEZI|nr:uncharacterized protein B0T26DRAFT_864599 [Lasiosphaeria miniovina]KAK0703662.1 hypothetical protein B0T26DRAFT_864599 [Lasiosphaeria miniovina]
MSSTQSGQVPKPYVLSYIRKPEFRVGDEVYLLNAGGSREGPYVIASLPSTGHCTLSDSNGNAIGGGQAISVDDVEAA